MDDVALWSATDQAAAIKRGELTSRDLLETFIDRIDRINPTVNAVVTTDFAAARDAADAADIAVSEGRELGALHGLPVTIKDALETNGMRSTGGATELADNVPTRDASVVSAVKQEGAIVFGKTNLPRWSGDIQSFNEIFGTTTNPWDASRVPGGSSGGAAAAVACGLTAFEIGTDIGGSIRFPASFNGIFGHKPSFGVVPSTGYLDHPAGGTTEADVNVIGPLTRSADDLSLLLEILRRKTPTWTAELRSPTVAAKEMRVAAWLDDDFCRVDSEVVSVLDAAVARMEADGMSVDRSARPDLDPARAAQLGGMLVSSATNRPGDTHGPSHREWCDWHIEREELRAAWAKFFTEFDAIVMPVGFVEPFAHVHEGDFGTRTLECNGEVRPYLDIVAWTLLTGMAYLPASVPPVGLSSGGLPIGMQVVGPYGSDTSTIALAGHVGSLGDGFVAPPVAQGLSG